tara:strand:+ start:6584 stop:7000 length:417 start_codon:yes stop_codon:yes gene_type:complete
MKYKLKENNKFTHIRKNTFDIPTGPLDSPITNGHELYEFLMSIANKERYQFKGRGRGSRKKYGTVRDLPIEYAEKIALYHSTRDHIAYKEIQELERSNSAWKISCQLENVMSAIEDHNAEFNNDLEVEFSNKEELCQE